MTRQIPISGKKGLWLLSISAVVIVVCVLVYRGASNKPGDTRVKTPYRIGAILPLSGSLGFMGKMEGDGMRLAVEDINGAGGVNGHPLELRFDDSQGKPDVAVTAAQRMLTVDGIKIIIASFSSVTLGLKPVVQQNGGILIGACMHPNFFKNAPNVFRFYIGVEDESRGFVKYLTSLKKEGKQPRIGCLYVEAPNVVEQLEEYVEPGLKEAGFAFAVKEPYRLSDKEFRDKVLKLRSADITHILLIGYGFLYPNIFRELKDQKLLGHVEIVGGWGFLYPNVEVEELERVVVVGPSYVFTKAESVRDFYSEFKIRFGYEANFDAAMTYAGIQLLAHGLKIGESTDVPTVSENLLSSKQVQTLIGKISLDPEGAVSFAVGVGKFHSGIIKAVE